MQRARLACAGQVQASSRVPSGGRACSCPSLAPAEPPGPSSRATPGGMSVRPFLTGCMIPASVKVGAQACLKRAVRGGNACSLPARTCLLLLLTEEELLGVRPDLRRRARTNVLGDGFDVLPAVSLHCVHKQPVLLGGPVSRLPRNERTTQGHEAELKGRQKQGTAPGRRGGGGGSSSRGGGLARLRQRRGGGRGSAGAA